MAEAMTEWCLFLSQLSAPLSQPLQALAERVEVLARRIPRRGGAGSFLLGFVFSLAFCFWLFFGLTLPLALGSPVGWVFPGVFAAGTAVPLLIGVALVVGGSAMAEVSLHRMSRLNRLLTSITGVIFLLAGINDTLTYWWI